MPRKPAIYLDASIPSALHQPPEGRRRLTRRFFGEVLSTYDVFVSAVVVAEIEATQDPDRRRDLLEAVRSYPVLPFAARAEQLAEQYREYVAMPLEDALHVAIATVEGMDYLATWNMRHLAKENTRRIVDNVNFLARLPAIFIVTPQDLLD